MLQILGEHESSVKKMLDEFGVYLKPSTFGKDVKPFLKDACSQIFGSATGLVDMMIVHVPSSKAGAANKVSSIAGVHDLLLRYARGFTHSHRLIEPLWRLQILIAFRDSSISRALLSNSHGGFLSGIVFLDC